MRSQRRYEILTIALLALGLTAGSACTRAGSTTLTPADSNSRIIVENAVNKGNGTVVFFYTSPDLGDPNSGKPCSLNFYTVTLKPNLPSAQADAVAKGVCGGGLARSRLLDSGDAVVMVRDRLERWRAGKQLSTQTFADIEAVSKLGVTTDDMGGQFYDISPSGDLVLLTPVGGRIQQSFPGISMVVTSLRPDGTQRWQLKQRDEGLGSTVKQVWAAADGGALIQIDSYASSAGMLTTASQLLYISAAGSKNLLTLAEPEKPFNFSDGKNVTPADMEAFWEHQRNSQPESVEKLGARARTGGGFDVLFRREGGGEARAGHFLYCIGPDGRLVSETGFGNRLGERGLEDWFDFTVSGDELILLSRVSASQRGVQAKRKKYPQNAVSTIDLRSGEMVTRLIPQDTLYLEAAMNAGDEEMQYLAGLPSGEPVLLTSVGEVPLAVSVGRVDHKPALRFDEATDRLALFIETLDENRAAVAQQADQRQYEAERETRKQQFNADMAAAVGMSPDAYAALSNKERKERMARSGDIDAMRAAAMKQGQEMQQALSQSGTTPEMNAQMQAALVQAQQAMAGAGYAMPELKDASENVSDTYQNPQQSAADSTPTNIVPVDAVMRGLLKFNNPGKNPTTLVIIDRRSGQALLTKDYADGLIDEYHDFGRYKLPLDQIEVLIQSADGTTLRELTPVRR